MKKSISSIIVSANVVALAMAAPAFAQDAEDNSGGIEEIIVTAQKREQRLQDVPVAVTAVTTETLQVNRVQNVIDLTGLAPGLMTRANAGSVGSPSFVMRGVSASASVPSQDRQVSQYLDGVYIGGIRGASFDLPDIQRIEVLRGPQGTLFGRNATAGAISITTRDPTGEFGLRQEVTVGNFSQLRTRTSVDLPAMGPFSAYVTYVHDERRGDTRNTGAGTVFDRTNPFTNIGRTSSPKWLRSKNFESGFAALKFEPSSDFSMKYKFNFTDGTNTPEVRTTTVINPNDLVGSMLLQVIAAQPAGGGAFGPVTLNPQDRRPKEYNNAFNMRGFLKTSGHNLTTEWQANDSLTFKNITAYRKARAYGPTTIAGLSGLQLTQAALPAYARFAAISTLGAGFFALTPEQQAGTISQFSAGLQPSVGRYFAGYEGQNYGKFEQFSTELQANYTSEQVNITAGAIYYWSNEVAGGVPGMPANFAFQPIPELLPLGNVSSSESTTKSIAAYAQAEFHITSQLDLQLGGRITQDKKHGGLTSGGTFVGTRDNGTITGTAFAPFTFKKTKPTFSVGLNYKPTDDILIYGKFSTAFLSGGAVGPFAFAPETVKSWEGGIKSDWFDRRLRVNLVGFIADYKHSQASQSGETLGRRELGVIVADNGPLKSRGFELEVTVAPVQGLTFGGNLGYQTSKLTDPNPVLAAGALEYKQSGIPTWTGNLNAQYVTQPLFGDATMLFRIDSNYQGKFRGITDAQIETRIPAFAPYEFNPARWLTNGRIALRNLDVGPTEVEVAVWGRNLFNVSKPVFPFPFGNILFTNSYQEARTYGVDFIVNF